MHVGMHGTSTACQSASPPAIQPASHSATQTASVVTVLTDTASAAAAHCLVHAGQEAAVRGAAGCEQPQLQPERGGQQARLLAGVLLSSYCRLGCCCHLTAAAAAAAHATLLLGLAGRCEAPGSDADADTAGPPPFFRRIKSATLQSARVDMRTSFAAGFVEEDRLLLFPVDEVGLPGRYNCTPRWQLHIAARGSWRCER